jgi:hypothetical protein
MNFNSKHPLWNSLLLRELGGDRTWLKGSVYEEVLRSDQTVIIEDLQQYHTNGSPVYPAALKAGYRNLLLTPLIYDQKLIGILELASPLPGQINGLSMFKILQIKSIFVNAVKHHVDEFENKVEAIMLEEYTAIHPAIRWRFRDAAIALIDRKEVSMSQDIYFEDVYPFYGSLDVRNSSRKQSAAIERDLLFNLQLAHEILNNGYKLLSFDILGELMSTVEARMEKLQKAFSSGDDLATAEFIRKELTPVITHLREQHPQLQLLTNRYMEFAMSETGICTLNRSAYEAALSLVNIAMINCLEDEEKALQKLSPCYFEKFRTDGVEYNIYAGPSISPGKHFDLLYLDNLRLRQLLWTCNIVQQTEELQPEIREMFEAASRATPCQSLVDVKAETCVEIAPLILAYGGTITLKFRPDEKRLDVEGAYNVRYEMMKKRLDKATISATRERLTQPGHIAIVYTGDREAEIYARHLDYLSTKGHIQPDWESLELEPLQGVKGLKAIRARVVSM